MDVQEQEVKTCIEKTSHLAPDVSPFLSISLPSRTVLGYCLIKTKKQGFSASVLQCDIN